MVFNAAYVLGQLGKIAFICRSQHGAVFFGSCKGAYAKPSDCQNGGNRKAENSYFVFLDIYSFFSVLKFLIFFPITIKKIRTIFH